MSRTLKESIFSYDVLVKQILFFFLPFLCKEVFDNNYEKKGCFCDIFQDFFCPQTLMYFDSMKMLHKLMLVKDHVVLASHDGSILGSVALDHLIHNAEHRHLIIRWKILVITDTSISSTRAWNDQKKYSLQAKPYPTTQCNLTYNFGSNHGSFYSNMNCPTS